MKRTPVSMAELYGARKMAEAGLPLTDHHADALTCAMQAVDPAHWYSSNEPPDKTARKMILSGEPWQERSAAIKHIMRKDLYLATAGLLYMHMMNPINDDTIYRVSIFPDGADVVCFGLDSIDSKLEGHYDRIDDLPDWVKERLAVLNMMSSTPPTNEVEGVGRRISGHVYWVFAPTTGTDASTSA